MFDRPTQDFSPVLVICVWWSTQKHFMYHRRIRIFDSVNFFFIFNYVKLSVMLTSYHCLLTTTCSLKMKDKDGMFSFQGSPALPWVCLRYISETKRCKAIKGLLRFLSKCSYHIDCSFLFKTLPSIIIFLQESTYFFFD